MSEPKQNTRSGQAVKPVKPKKKKSALRWAPLLLLVPVVYVAVQLFIIYVPNMRYQTAIPYTMMDYIPVQGFVVMDSQPVTGGGGTLYYTVPEGERVVTGAPVADIFANEAAAMAQTSYQRAEAELQQLESAKRILAEGGDVGALSKQKLNGVYQLLNEIDTQNYAGLNASKAEIMLAANKMAVVTGEPVSFDERIGQLTAQKESYAAQAVVQGVVTAPSSGYFVPSPKFDRQVMEYAALEQASPVELQAMLEAEPTYYGDEVIGHIVADYRWSFFTTIPSKDAARLNVGNKLKISFSDYSENAMPVTVQNIVVDEAAETAKVELLCEYMNAQVLQMRSEKAKIILKEEKGLRVDKNALHIVNGENGVYIKYGNMAYFRRIEILQEDEHYLLVSAVEQKGINELQMYDEIIVDAGSTVLENETIL
ncbi:hypothetical protein LJC61_08895 [Ruminococcaceae bacterium OttesenSCG-928-A16]|nr:hypothetical protein [Ruminococcaceae bacterium OttesenSCG-928-A16]